MVQILSGGGVSWDDLRFFLSVARTGTIRGAAKELGVNHATVSRRINSFEASIGERLFERGPKGYICTRIGHEIFDEAEGLEKTLTTVERKVTGQKSELVGDIRITMPEGLGEYLLMQDLADFCISYPDIQLELIDSARPLNLANREADIAFRLCEVPPDYLVGKKIASLHRACYVAKRFEPKIEEQGWLEQQNWIGWSDKLRKPVGKIAREYPRLESKHKIMRAGLQLEACKQGMGVGVLPCFLADPDPGLIRVPPYISEHRMDLWILYHPDLRKNVKVQTFVKFILSKLHEKKDLLEGCC